MMMDFQKQAERFGTDTRYGLATSVDFSTYPLKVVIDESHEITANVVIIATGASAKFAGSGGAVVGCYDGDPDRLVQATWNLVRNAIQAGAANVSLRTRAEFGARIGEQVHALALRMEIGDDGRGVPESLAEQIFLPLVSGRADGSGLGLAMAQQVAREHGGSLGYRSRPGHTVFTLLLPLAEEGDAPQPVPDEEAVP